MDGRKRQDTNTSVSLPEMNIEDADGDADGECDENHGKEQVLAQQGDGQGGGRDDLGQQEEEHSERQQDRDTQSHLGVARENNYLSDYAQGKENSTHF